MNSPENDTKLSLLKQLLESAESALDGAHKLLSEILGAPVSSRPAKSHILPTVVPGEGKVIEGVFDGQNMIGKDGKNYSVPANYASKSKLVEGDTLKLTIADDGSFIYKQIGPADRKRLIGKLIRDEVTDEYVVDVQGRRYKLLRASITYFKGELEDEVVVLVPKNSESIWAAVENIIKNPGDVPSEVSDILETPTVLDDLA